MTDNISNMVSKVVSEHYKLFCSVIILFLGSLFSICEVEYDFPDIPLITFVLMVICSVLSKSIPAYIVFVYLIQGMYRKGKNKSFWLLTLSLLFVFLLIEIFVNNAILHYFNQESRYESMNFIMALSDIVSQNATWIMVMLGSMIFVTFNDRIEAYKEKQKAATSYLQLKVQSLKKQVSPDLLCNTVHNMGVLAKQEPDKASDMLMKLSKLLRYQLYDGKREMLFLDSEVKFLETYLSLMKDNDFCSDYSIKVEGKTMGVMVPSLLFVPCIPLVADKQDIINIVIRYDEGMLEFTMNNRHEKNDVKALEERLMRLYPERYKVSSSKDKLTVNIRLR